MTSTEQQIIELLTDGLTKSVEYIARSTKRQIGAVRTTLLRLQKQGVVKRSLASGGWRLTNDYRVRMAEEMKVADALSIAVVGEELASMPNENERLEKRDELLEADAKAMGEFLSEEIGKEVVPVVVSTPPSGPTETVVVSGTDFLTGRAIEETLEIPVIEQVLDLEGFVGTAEGSISWQVEVPGLTESIDVSNQNQVEDVCWALNLTGDALRKAHEACSTIWDERGWSGPIRLVPVPLADVDEPTDDELDAIERDDVSKEPLGTPPVVFHIEGLDELRLPTPPGLRELAKRDPFAQVSLMPAPERKDFHIAFDLAQHGADATAYSLAANAAFTIDKAKRVCELERELRDIEELLTDLRLDLAKAIAELRGSL